MGSFRYIEDRDPPAIAALMNSRSPGLGDAWLDRYDWQFATNPWRGDLPIGKVYEYGGEVRGFALFMPQPIRIGREILRASWAMDLYLDPAHRKPATGALLIESIFGVSKNAPLLSTSANRAAVRALTRLGSDEAPEGDVSLARILRPLSALGPFMERKLVGRTPRARLLDWSLRPNPDRYTPDGWHSSEHDGDWAKLARLWTSVCAAYPLTTDRNAEYLEWRYGPRAPACKIVQIRCPNRVLRAWYAYLLARRGGRLTAWISNLLDLMVDPLDSVAIRVSAEDFIRRSRQEGAAIAQVKGLRKTLRASFSSAGFRPRRLPQNPFLCTLPSTLSAEEASELRNVRDQWHFVSGDGDAGFG